MRYSAVKRLLCLLLALLCLTGCTRGSAEQADIAEPFGSTPASTAEDSVAVPTVGNGTFSMPCNASYGWDPYNCLSMENQAVMDLVFEGLFTMTPTYDYEPVLCKEYTVSTSGLTYTITLVDAEFSNGATLTAQDVVYSFQKAADSDLYGARFRDVNSMEATDSKTVTIYMANPNDRLLCMLDFPIIPSGTAPAAAVGTGPFIRDGLSRLTKNQKWWKGADTVSFDLVNLYASSSAEDTRDHFEIDMLHFVYNDPLDPSAATFHCDYELWNSRNSIMQYLGFNMSAGVFQDQEVRQGVINAIDRADIAESVYHNFADAASLPVSSVSDNYFDDLARIYTYDRDTALATLMDSSSFYLPDDHPVVTGEIFDEDYVAPTFDEEDEETTEETDTEEDVEEEPEEDELLTEEEAGSTLEEDSKVRADAVAYNRITMLVLSGSLYRSQAAEMVADCLAKVGFTVTINELDPDEFIYTVNNLKEDWDLMYTDVYLTPDFDLRTILYPGNKLNYSTVPEDSELRDLYYDALENSGNRYDLYEYIMEQAYICPVLFQNNAVFTTRGVFTGLNPAPGNLFYGIENITING